VRLLDEVLQHLLGDVEVRDHTVAHGPDRLNRLRRAPDHPFGFFAEGLDLGPAAALLAHGNDGRLVEHDPFVADVDQGVGGAEVDRQISGEQSPKEAEHAWKLSVRRVG
jgi:hypothetical protein